MCFFVGLLKVRNKDTFAAHEKHFQLVQFEFNGNGAATEVEFDFIEDILSSFQYVFKINQIISFGDDDLAKWHEIKVVLSLFRGFFCCASTLKLKYRLILAMHLKTKPSGCFPSVLQNVDEC